jgi:hypothetical protein
MPANRKEIVQRINEGFRDNNVEKVLSFCTDDLTWTMVGDTTVRGKDAIRKWMASMDPQPPKFTIQQTVAEGDVVVTRGDMLMQQTKNGPWIPFTFCDIYRFAGDKVGELTAFVIRADRSKTADRQPDQVQAYPEGVQMTTALPALQGINRHQFRALAGRAATLGACAIGATAIGATALGAAAIGRLAIGAFAAGRGRIRTLTIDQLNVGNLRVDTVLGDRSLRLS